MPRQVDRLASCHRPATGKWIRRALLFFILATFAFHFPREDSSAEISGKDSPEKYGNLLLARKSVSAGKKAVLFTHWTHRILYSCRFCHFELGFPQEANQIDITMDMNRSGRFCGFCHNGVEAFGTAEQDCPKCHYGVDEYDYGEKLDRLPWFPESPYGNKVNWSEAIEGGDIKPLFCFDKETCKTFDFEAPDDIEVEVRSEIVPPVIFPHKHHTHWLDCLNCHRGNLFLTGGKLRFPNQKIMRRDRCEGCHGRVAFPMDNCGRCHLGMEM